ncbi:DUF3784 domain-containing protein [Anaerosacchariphilus polymeriproducens]|uniref:DUF3784 domain-containing protein n=1 Tax=Anaerosacchariphilus polymeriproducens TaxID=1812858 RepID=UPI0013906857|nr:DUF3784 domain-containing protein [Anaerosacchariphilus polymeriproducens]
MKKIEITICISIAVVIYILSYIQFREKGMLLNNAYLYSSKDERMKMDKKPYYRQSGTVFSLIGTTLLLNAIQIVTEWRWIFYLVIMVIVTTIFYTIVSSILIEKKK